jgi:Cu2+-containing amine oxidase
VSHPLDPLSAAELGQVCAVLRAESLLGGPRLLSMLQLEEPAKEAVGIDVAAPGGPCH